MPSLGPRATDSWLVHENESQGRERRRNRVLSLLAEGLPIPQSRIFELLRLLGEPVLDLNGISEIIRSEPLLNTHVQGLFRTSSAAKSSTQNDLSELLILLGSERLRILALGCALAQFAGKHLPVETMRDFWQHSILTALLSQRMAREAHMEGVERAYLAGLLHDIGRLPLLITASEDGNSCNHLTRMPDELQAERAYFGLDHADVGRWMALAGSLPAWMVDVLTHHHDHAGATVDPALVAVVAAADRCSQFPSADTQEMHDFVWDNVSPTPFGAN